MSLFDLKPGQIGVIKDISGDIKLAKRLFALGFVNDTEVYVKNSAPLGDPIIINVRSFDIAIRKKDAKNISLREI